MKHLTFFHYLTLPEFAITTQIPCGLHGLLPPDYMHQLHASWLDLFPLLWNCLCFFLVVSSNCHYLYHLFCLLYKIVYCIVHCITIFHVYRYLYVYVHKYIYLYVFIIDIYICMYIDISVYMYIDIYMSLYVDIYLVPSPHRK